MRRFTCYILTLAALAWTSQAIAEDAYYDLPLDKLELTEGSLPKAVTTNYWGRWQMDPYAVLDGAGEVYVQSEWMARFMPGRIPQDAESIRNHIAVCAPAGKDITGKLYLPKPLSHQYTPLLGPIAKELPGYEIVKFKIPASAADKNAKNNFLKIKISCYQDLLNQNISGGAWFRHQMNQAKKALGQKADEAGITPQPRPRQWNRFGDVDATYDLFTGGRAISENLQLDRLMPVAKSGEETVDINSLEGITVQEIDWKSLIKGMEPNNDPLAEKVPFDQHVVFFPAFKAALIMSDESKNIRGMFFKMTEAHTDDTSTNAMYEKQLCLTVSGLSRLIGPKLVRSVALTGSDPYYFTGTDVAVLFESPESTVLEQLILAQAGIKAHAQKDAKPISGEIAGVKYHGFLSPDRSISSYIAKINGMVVVTNSTYQLERLASVAKGETKSIASLDEYIYFRNQYKSGNTEETAFFFLSDATIRRWCSPRWRIANSRRVRDAAVMADLQASQLDKLVEGKITTGPIYTDLPIAEKGELQLTPTGVVSSTLGSFEFMTPIAELPLKSVTKNEAEAYNRWRDGYQSNWRWAFDPIGLRLGVDKKKLSADLIVMPLIWGTEYREFISVSHGAKFSADAGDIHNTLGHYILAINKDSHHFHEGESFMSMMAPGIKVEPLAWVGDYVSLYADDDPFWDELAKVDPADIEKHALKYAGRLPIGLRVDVSSGFKLTAFLVAFRAFIDQTAPGMVLWETQTYKDQPYVKISPTELARKRDRDIENLAIYYVASGDSLLVTLNEPLLKRSIDRQLAREEAKKKGEKLPEIEHPWLAENMALAVQGKLIKIVAALTQVSRPSTMQINAWNNLPILNEWKRRYPNEDPVKLHARFWHEHITCPSGGEYVWNEKWQTMESTAYGHPGEPKDGPALMPIYQALERADFGITFEEQGLRAKVKLERD